MQGGGFNRGSMPRTLVCYICGREYGTRSLGIHLKTCIKKWHMANEQKDRKDRRPIPQCPPALFKLLDKKTVSGLDLKEYNEEAYDNYNTAVLVACENCGRTFSDTALRHHRGACTKDKPLFKRRDNTKPSTPTGTGERRNVVNSHAVPSKNSNTVSSPNGGGYGGQPGPRTMGSSQELTKGGGNNRAKP
jgi:hypothetical protein